MSTIDFTNFSATNPGLEDILDPAGAIGQHDSAIFEIVNKAGGAADGFTFRFKGSGFTYSGEIPTGGTIEGVTISGNSNEVAYIDVPSGSTSLLTIWNALQSSGAVAALDALLAGPDIFNGGTSNDNLRAFGASSGDQ